ncbi:Nuclear envelope morphology protein 1, partial [Podila epigama]
YSFGSYGSPLTTTTNEQSNQTDGSHLLSDSKQTTESTSSHHYLSAADTTQLHHSAAVHHGASGETATLTATAVGNGTGGGGGGPSTNYQITTPASSLTVALCRSLVLKYIYLTYLFLFHIFVVLPSSALARVSRRVRLCLGTGKSYARHGNNSNKNNNSSNNTSSGLDVDVDKAQLSSAPLALASTTSSSSLSLSSSTSIASTKGSFWTSFWSLFWSVDGGSRSGKTNDIILDTRNNLLEGVDAVGEKFLQQYTLEKTARTTATSNSNAGNSILRRSSRFKSKSDLDEFEQSSVVSAGASAGVNAFAHAFAPGPASTQRRSSVTRSTILSHGYGTDSMAENESGDNSATPRSMTGARMRQRMGRPMSGLGMPVGSSGSAAARKKTLVLDLDETLIHSTSRGSRSQGYMVEVLVDRHACLYYVYKRPHVDYFLKKVSEWYKLVIFTASMAEYADPVIDWLDQNRTLFEKRYFRQACHFKNGSYLKDLTLIEPDLSSVCLLDNSPISYSLNKENGIPIDSWINDPNDEALLDLLPFLDALRFTEDVRSILSLRTV